MFRWALNGCATGNSLIYGRFGGLRFAKWLIYGTETRISRVWALQFRAPYSRYHDLGAIYKPLGILQLSESALRKPSSVVCGRISPFSDRRGPILSDFGDGGWLGGGGCGGVGKLSLESDRKGLMLSDSEEKKLGSGWRVGRDGKTRETAGRAHLESNKIGRILSDFGYGWMGMRVAGQPANEVVRVS